MSLLDSVLESGIAILIPRVQLSSSGHKHLDSTNIAANRCNLERTIPKASDRVNSRPGEAAELRKARHLVENLVDISPFTSSGHKCLAIQASNLALSIGSLPQSV